MAKAAVKCSPSVLEKGVWPFNLRCRSVMSCFAESLQFKKPFSKIYARKYILYFLTCFKVDMVSLFPACVGEQYLDVIDGI